MIAHSIQDERIPRYIVAAEMLQRGHFAINVPIAPADDIGRLGKALRDLACSLDQRYREIQHISQITSRINAGLLLDDILDSVYHDFHEFIPYNRIGLSLLEDGGRAVRAHWVKSDQPNVQLTTGYSAPLAGSSLETIIATGRPRIINDLLQHARSRPDSESTRLILAEGIRSSLTCPLVANGVPIGFISFSSIHPDAYANAQVSIFEHIAEQLSVIVEKGCLVAELAAQKAAIERQNVELRRLSELKNVFLAIAAHDLRNPLSNIQLATYLLLNPDGPASEAERHGLHGDIDRLAKYMMDLLNDLLDVAQIESGCLRLSPAPIELSDLLVECVQRHARLAEPKGTRVALESAPAGLLMADAVRLRQVMDNLISNAIKYSPPGSAVRVRALRADGAWRVEVQDQGPGITSEDRKQLFQDFSRLSARPTGGEKSTGLGLAITRRVIEAHGGRIGVDSAPGHGATFWFTVPDAQDHSLAASAPGA